MQNRDQSTSNRWQDFKTPEGVGIRLETATIARRASAFFIDFLIISAITLVLIVAVLSLVSMGEGVGMAFVVLAWFVLLNFYFPLFEGLKGGMTPGKMATKIRVIDRGGGALTFKGVFTRNLMRDLELWLPLKIVLFSGLILSDLPVWAIPIAMLWAILLLLFPLFNSRQLRLGDLVAGTMVVEYPKVTLLPDLAKSPEKKKEVNSGLEFTVDQLSVYGVYELQVLEDVLRRKKRADLRTLHGVAEKIQKKIGWTSPQPTKTLEFLEAFYRAQRARLENQMLLGKKKLHKFDD